MPCTATTGQSGGASSTETCQHTGYPPRNLCLELTERCRSLDMVYLRLELQFFRAWSVRGSLDNFGTGFSSLDLICDFPVGSLKNDQSFIFRILKKQNAQMVVKATISLARKLGIAVCLKGVENHQLRDFILHHSADHHQGFYYVHSQPASIFSRYLEKNWAARPDNAAE